MWSELLAKEKFSLFSLLQTGVAASRYWPHHLHVNSDGSHTAHRIRAFSNSWGKEEDAHSSRYI